MYHSFNVHVAELYGVHAAILLENIKHWIDKNKANEKHFYDGEYWTYNSKRAFSELFPYMTTRQTDYALKKLIDDEIIISGNYNQTPYDRTLWYTITKKGYSILQNCEMEKHNLVNENNKIVEPIPYINTNINTNKKQKEIYKEKEKKHRYGEYKNVLLTDTELEKLKAEYPSDYKDRIERLSCYIESTGKSYKNHLATIRNWDRMDKDRKKASEKPKRNYDTSIDEVYGIVGDEDE